MTVTPTSIKTIKVVNGFDCTVSENVEAFRFITTDTAGTYEKADVDSVDNATVSGMVLAAIDSGNQGRALGNGSVIEIVGATVTKGTSYFLGADGIIEPYGDLSGGDQICQILVATSTTRLELNIAQDVSQTV